MKLTAQEHKKLKILKVVLVVLVLVAAFLTHPLTTRFLESPAAVRYPTTDHYHFRTRLFIEGQAVDFSQPEFQETYEAGQCSALLADTPIHFHDNIDQMTHVHWDGMTGGLLLKYYGWNFIGGNDNTLGWRFDQDWSTPKRLAVHGDILPAQSEKQNYYVYVTTEDGYQQKDWQDFLSQDFEKFFDKKSNLNDLTDSITYWDRLFPSVSAHGGVDDGHEQQDLKRVNNLLGDVAIFAQEQPPSDDVIRQAFNQLIELPDSTCGG